MSGDSVINIAGTVDVTSPRRDTQIGLSQTIDTTLSRYKEVMLPHGGSYTSLTTVTLDLPSGITEALMVIFVTNVKAVLVLRSSDANAPGPIALGIQGIYIMTLYPGEGITSIQAYNPDPQNDVILEVATVSLGNSNDTPSFWFPPSP